MTDTMRDLAPVAVPGVWRPVAYMRISLDREGAGLGVERQWADVRDLAARLGVPEPEPFTDNDVSAYSGKRRPGYEQVLSGVREGRWNVLLVWHVDRLTRSPKELEEIVDLANATGLRVETVKGGRVDLSTPEGRMQARILGGLARYESEHKSDRVKRRMLQNAEAGRPHGGAVRAFGYEADGLTVVPDEAAVVEVCVRRVAAGASLYGLTKELNGAGVGTVTGRPWSATTLKLMLTNPRYAGLRAHNGRVVGPAVWPAVVKDSDLWEACQAVLTDPKRKTSPGNKPKRLVSGIAVCGWEGCGEVVRSGGFRDGVAYYRCSMGGHVRRKVELVDDVVSRFVVGWLARDGVTFDSTLPVSVPAGPPVDRRSQIDAVRLRIDQVEDAMVGNPVADLEGISERGLKRNLARLQEQLVDLEREQVLEPLPSPLAGVTAANFRGLPLERRRAVVAYLCRVVVLRTNNGPHADETSVHVEPHPDRFPVVGKGE